MDKEISMIYPNQKKFILEYILLFLFSMDFVAKSNYFFLILLCIVFINIVIFEKKVFIPTQMIWVMLFSCFYFLMYSIYNPISFASVVYYLIGPIGAYLIGVSFITRTDSEKALLKIVIIIPFGLFIHGFLNMYIKISTSGIVLSETLIDVWKSTPILRTLEGLFLTAVSCMLFALLVVRDKMLNKFIRFILILCGVLSILSTFILANRSIIIIFIIVFSLSSILFFREKRKNTVKYIGRLSTLVLALLSIVVLNIFNIQSYFIQSPLLQRLSTTNSGMLDTSRYELYTNFINNFIYYPFGGRQMSNVLGNPYAHNTWFDIYMDVGAIPFIFFLIYTFSICITLLNFMKSGSSLILKYVTFAVYGAFLLTFAVEPIILANPYYFMLFLLINGSVEKYMSIISKEKKLSVNSD